MWVGVVAAGADVAGTSGATLLTGGRVGGWGGNTVKLLYDSGWQKDSLTNSATLFDEAYGNYVYKGLLKI